MTRDADEELRAIATEELAEIEQQLSIFGIEMYQTLEYT
jgi:hypothetical protein